jgi:putative NADH-flavin reductase
MSNQQTIAVLNGTARTMTHLTQQALAKGDKVRAIVRSATRFLSKTGKHDNLSVHEWNDFADVDTLAKALEGVDVVYVALVAAGKGTFSLDSDVYSDTVLLKASFAASHQRSFSASLSG